MSNNKTIELNPMFLSTSAISMAKNKSSAPKRQKKEKPMTTVNPNKIKKQLLAKIKDFQNKGDNSDNNNDNTNINIKINTEEDEHLNDNGFADEFNKSLNFLSELSKKRKSNNKPQKKRNETLKKGKIEHDAHMQVATELPDDMKEYKKHSTLTSLQLKPVSQHNSVDLINVPVNVSNNAINSNAINSNAIDSNVTINKEITSNSGANNYVSDDISNYNYNKPSPLYSNLKNGTKPTYRQFHNKTQKIHGHQHNKIKPLIQIDNEQIGGLNNTNEKLIPPPNKKHFKRRITRTLKYSLGKHKNGKVSVLIKNAKTRRKVQTEQAVLKQKSIHEIKLYLRSKNLLKVGSEVPNDVLRQMYENAILAGDVTNKSKDTLIHNYFNDK